MATTPPLHDVVKTGDLAALKAAVRRAKDISARAMVGAAQRAWQPGLEVLVRAGGDLNGSYRNYRPLHALIQEEPHAESVASADRLACLTWMLDHGADPEQRGAWPAARALIIAAFGADPRFVTALKLRAKLDVFTGAALGDVSCVGAALSHDRESAVARDGTGGLTALQCVAGSRMGRQSTESAAKLLDCSRLLIDAGADVNARTRSWAHDVSVTYFAIRSRQLDLLTLLLDRGADATAALPTAAWEAHADAVNLLLSRGAKLDDAVDGDRPLLNNLIRWGQFAQATDLLKRGASPNRADPQGWTAMHQAVSRGNVKMLRELLARGGDVTRKDNEGTTPLAMAQAMGRDPITATLKGAARR